MRRFLLALAAAFLLGGSTNVLAQGADGATLAWTVRGQLNNLPGSAASVPFTCSVTAANPTCATPSGLVNLKFLGTDGDSFALQFQPAPACSGGTCTAQIISGGADDTTSCSASVIEGVSRTIAYLPCTECFGGVQPMFSVDWQARATCVTTTTSTSTSSTTTST